MFSRHNSGFTLIEIMVVVVIIGVLLSFAVLSISDGGQIRKLEQEAQRLAFLLTLASQEAIMQNKEMGIFFEHNSYNFYQLQEHKWQVVHDNKIFKARMLPLGMQVEIHLEGEQISLGETTNTPQLFLLSSGEFTPFEITFTAKSEPALRYKLTGNVTGVLSVYQDKHVTN